MKIIKEKLGYIIEDSDEMINNEDIADFISLFLGENSIAIFASIDIEYFLNHLQNEDENIQNFYNKLFEFNRSQGYGILKDDKDEREKRKFIEERTVFINNESDILDIYPGRKKRRTIWYKVNNKQEIIKAINMDQFFKCIILQKGKDFYEYDYGIKQYETEEGMDLRIIERQIGTFEKYIYPKIYEKNILLNNLYD
ncbi:MAG: hypothetical protein IJH34_03085 [Romboutsia sp.]|nr:hypothetical protein [Romboutsia sp.]